MNYIVGMTGGIGCGKSAAAQEFHRLGAEIVDTDAIAHELTGVNGAAIADIRRLFGDAGIDTRGAMDRAWVRAHVFADPAERRRLEALLHPMIRAESERRLAGTTGPYAMLVVPLLIESRNYQDRVNRVLVIDCPDDVRIDRILRRSAIAQEEVRRIMAAQVQRDQRLAAADDVIDNSGSLDALRGQVEVLHQRYLSLSRRA